MDDVSTFVHGTTVALNALLQRQGPTIGLLCTEGFRDALEIRRGDWVHPYDFRYRPRPPLVPRRLRQCVTERVRANGEGVVPVDEESVRRALEVFEEAGVDSIAVAFLNSYANPEHELTAERLLRGFGFMGDISLSHQVTGEYREYERTSTTVVDVFTRPRMKLLPALPD